MKLQDQIIYTLPAYWNYAIINNDFSGLDDNEKKIVNQFLLDVVEEIGHARFVDCTEGPDFLKYHDAKYLGVLAADCLDYYIYKD